MKEEGEAGLESRRVAETEAQEHRAVGVCLKAGGEVVYFRSGWR